MAKTHRKAEPRYRALIISLAITLLMLLFGGAAIEELGISKVFSGLLLPLLRLLLFIAMGLLAGQIIEAGGWTRSIAVIARPLFRFSHLGNRPSAAFTTAFFSGTAANAMLLEFYEDGKITKKELFLSNFVNQFPAFFLHLPTTTFIVLPLTGFAGGLYLLITFVAALIRTCAFLLYGHFTLPPKTDPGDSGKDDQPRPKKRPPFKEILKQVKNRFPARFTSVALMVIPIYTFVFLINSAGFFTWAQNRLADTVALRFMPVEALSMVVISFAAEFTSGFAAAGALLEAGVLTTRQTVAALLIGNIIAFPVRAIRHQLPRYMGIFSPKMGTQILLLGQIFRVSSLILTGIIYYLISG